MTKKETQEILERIDMQNVEHMMIIAEMTSGETQVLNSALPIEYQVGMLALAEWMIFNSAMKIPSETPLEP